MLQFNTLHLPAFIIFIQKVWTDITFGLTLLNNQLKCGDDQFQITPVIYNIAKMWWCSLFQIFPQITVRQRLGNTGLPGPPPRSAKVETAALIGAQPPNPSIKKYAFPLQKTSILGYLYPYCCWKHPLFHIMISGSCHTLNNKSYIICLYDLCFTLSFISFIIWM